MAKSLSQTATIKLSAKGEKFEVDMLKDQEVRDTELNILISCFEAQANEEKQLKNLNLCIDCAETVRCLTDEEDEITLTKQDLDLWKKGFELTVKRRPGGWFYARKLMKQLEEPNFGGENEQD